MLGVGEVVVGGTATLDQALLLKGGAQLPPRDVTDQCGTLLLSGGDARPATTLTVGAHGS